MGAVRRQVMLGATAFAALLAVALVLAVAVLVGVAVLVRSVSGSPYPSADKMPTLPSGYETTEPDLQCGSGGCWLETDVTGPPGQSAAETVEELEGAVSRCRANGLLDRRELCTYVYQLDDGTVRVALSLEEWG